MPAAACWKARAAPLRCTAARTGCTLRQGVLHGHNDHRVVMSLAVLALSTGIPLTVDDAEAITKSWPNFFEAIKPLGAEVEYA